MGSLKKRRCEVGDMLTDEELALVSEVYWKAKELAGLIDGLGTLAGNNGVDYGRMLHAARGVRSAKLTALDLAGGDVQANK